MDVLESLRLSWRAIRAHKLRSTLTTLGVIIGVAAVITFVSLGASLSAGIIGDVTGEQPPVANVWAGPNGSVGSGQGGPGFGAQPVFTEHDLAELADLVGVEAVIPYGQLQTTALTYRDDSVAASTVVATTPRYLDDQAFRTGRNFDAGAAEIVLNPAAAAGFEEPATVGGTLTITLGDGNTRNATVVGILNTSGSTGPFEGFGTAPRAYVSADAFYTTRVARPQTDELQRVYAMLMVVAEDHQMLERVQTRVEAYLQSESDAATLLPSTFRFAVQTNEELLAQIQSILDQLTGFVTGIALISLFVGAIGIANIMLVSVTERTREIGIMKAVGAQRRDLLQLFLVEAIVLGVIGSVLGTILGVGVGYAATQVLGFPFSIPVEWGLVAIVVGVVVGVVAGLYPAWNASRTDPIDALRYE